MIKKAEEKFDEELMLEIIAKLKEQLKEIEFSDNDKAIYYDLLKDNDNYEDSFVGIKFNDTEDDLDSLEELLKDF